MTRGTSPFSFSVAARCSVTCARAGFVRTPHGAIETPAFLPVGTRATVKAMNPRQLREQGVQAIMVNAYHLALRPGADTIAKLGQVHCFAGWSGPVMADSGGFQAFSLGDRASFDRDGVSFRSPDGGAELRFTPESVMEMQGTLGADIALPLDVCTPYPATRSQAEQDAALTRNWAVRARSAHSERDQALYGIVQGSVFDDLRRAGAAARSQPR